MSKKRETLLDNMEDDELDEYREIWESDPNLKNLGYDSGEAKKLKKTDDLYIFFWPKSWPKILTENPLKFIYFMKIHGNRAIRSRNIQFIYQLTLSLYLFL